MVGVDSLMGVEGPASSTSCVLYTLDVLLELVNL